MELVCCERRRGSKEMLYIAEMSKGKEDIATIGSRELHLKRKYSIAKITIEGYSITWKWKTFHWKNTQNIPEMSTMAKENWKTFGMPGLPLEQEIFCMVCYFCHLFPFIIKIIENFYVLFLESGTKSNAFCGRETTLKLKLETSHISFWVQQCAIAMVAVGLTGYRPYSSIFLLLLLLLILYWSISQLVHFWVRHSTWSSFNM